MPLPPRAPCKSQSQNERAGAKSNIQENARPSSLQVHQELGEATRSRGAKSWCRECRCKMRRGRQRATTCLANSSSSSSSSSCESRNDETSSTTSPTLTSCRSSCSTQSQSCSASSQSLASTYYSSSISSSSLDAMSDSDQSPSSSTCSGGSACSRLWQSQARCYHHVREVHRRRQGQRGEICNQMVHRDQLLSQTSKSGLAASSASLDSCKLPVVETARADKHVASDSGKLSARQALSLSLDALDRHASRVVVVVGTSRSSQRNQFSFGAADLQHHGQDKSSKSTRRVDGRRATNDESDNSRDSSTRVQLANGERCLRQVERDKMVPTTSRDARRNIGGRSPPESRQDSERASASASANCRTAQKQADANYDRLRWPEDDDLGDAMGVAAAHHGAPDDGRKQLAPHYHSFRSMCELNNNNNNHDDRQSAAHAAGSPSTPPLHAKNRKHHEVDDQRRSNESTKSIDAHHKHLSKPQQQDACDWRRPPPVYRNQLQSFYWHEFESHLEPRRQWGRQEASSSGGNVGANGKDQGRGDKTSSTTEETDDRDLELVQLAENLAEFAQRTGCLHCHCRHQLLMLVRNEQILNLLTLRIQQGSANHDNDHGQVDHGQDNKVASLSIESIDKQERERGRARHRRRGSRGERARVGQVLAAREGGGRRRRRQTRSDDDEPSQLSPLVSCTSLNSHLNSSCSSSSSRSSVGSLWPPRPGDNVPDNEEEEEGQPDEWAAAAASEYNSSVDDESTESERGARQRQRRRRCGEEDDERGGAQIEMPEVSESDTPHGQAATAAATVVTSNKRSLGCTAQLSARAAGEQDCSSSSSSSSPSTSTSTSSSLVPSKPDKEGKTNMSSGICNLKQERGQRRVTSEWSAATVHLSSKVGNDSAPLVSLAAFNERAAARTSPAAAAPPPPPSKAAVQNGRAIIDEQPLVPQPPRQRRLAVSGASADRSEQLGPAGDELEFEKRACGHVSGAAHNAPSTVQPTRTPGFGLLLSRARLMTSHGSQQNLWAFSQDHDNEHRMQPVKSTVRKQALKFHQSQMNNPNLTMRRRHQYCAARYAQIGPSRTVDLAGVVGQGQQAATCGLGASSLDLAGVSGSPNRFIQSRRPLLRAGSQQELALVLNHLLEAQQRHAGDETRGRRAVDEESFERFELDEQDRRRTRRRALDAGKPPLADTHLVGQQQQQDTNNLNVKNFMTHSELELYFSLAEKCPDTNSQLVR